MPTMLLLLLLWLLLLTLSIHQTLAFDNLQLIFWCTFIIVRSLTAKTCLLSTNNDHTANLIDIRHDDYCCTVRVSNNNLP